jgi:hypothetical protein
LTGTTRAARSALAAALILPGIAAADSCGDDPRRHALDFWLGSWNVSWNDEFVGHNLVESVLEGCAVTERWLDVRGRSAFSLFWFDRETNRWKQVFLTDQAFRTGATKEKSEVTEMTTPTRIRFQGRYPGRGTDASIDDRTTLTLEAPGLVRQHIEVSEDGGSTWRTVFDGTYRRAE